MSSLRNLIESSLEALLVVPGARSLARRMAQNLIRSHRLGLLNRGRIYNLLSSRTVPTAEVDCAVSVPELPGICLNLRLHLADELSRQWYFWGYDHYEAEVRRVMWALLQETPSNQTGTLIDIGANLGYFTLYLGALLRHRGDGTLQAFEPSPTVFAQLQRNLAFNPSLPITLNQAAVADSPGEAKLFLADEQTWGHCAASLIDKGVNEQVGSVKVAVECLDHFVTSRGIKHVSLIKMDCEGAEARALAGALETIQRDRPHIILELIPRYADSYQDLFDQPIYRSYRKFQITADGLVEHPEAYPSYQNRDWLFTVRPPVSLISSAARRAKV